LGADIIIEGKRADIHGLYPLRGNRVTATDLRGGAALVVAGLACEGVTEIHECHHIERGYEDICRDLSSLGAAIRGME
ncbi:MAG TPA: UDP-N-acetylglucosamine 1-carboxyvinyltransferase, partial [Lachnoclostridium sp.]|nr:UDP-N-acetylglucosamine 1-carboxyvinyltransferase [Lachnoclostridium sp.]